MKRENFTGTINIPLEQGFKKGAKRKKGLQPS
jgi:hypothetical protein